MIHYDYQCLCGQYCRNFDEAMFHFKEWHFDTQFEEGGSEGGGYDVEEGERK